MNDLGGWARARTIAAALICFLSAASAAEARDVFARISVRNARVANGYYGRTFEFPAAVRDYSEQSFYGYSFRQELSNGGVRELEIARARTAGAYLIATDLFPNGRFSTMSHTVLMVFPRRRAGSDLYALSEEPTGNLRIHAPDGSWLLIDGRTEAVLPTAGFELAHQGATGTAPRLHHNGLHLEITAVGRSPFLRGTPVTVEDSLGGSCRLSTDDVFRYGSGPESDVFRYDGDPDLFRFLAVRCSGLHLPSDGFEAAKTSPAVQPAVFTTEEARPIPVARVKSDETVAETITTTAPNVEAAPPPAAGGAVPSVVRLLSRPQTPSKRTLGPTSLLSGRLW